MTQYPLWQQLNTLKQATWVDLTHTFDPEIPRFSEFEKGEVSTLFTVKDHGFYVQRWNIVTQYGTHIDAPIHFVENKRYLEDIDLKELVLPLIVLDFSTEVANNNDFIVTRAHIEAWEKSMVLLNLALLLHFVPIGQNVGLILKRLKTKMRTDNNMHRLGIRCFEVLN